MKSVLVHPVLAFALLLLLCASCTPPSNNNNQVVDNAGGKKFTFGVWLSEGCADDAKHTVFTLDTTCACFVVSYKSPSGAVKTNAHYGYSCGPNGVTFTQLAGASTCQSDPLPAGAKLIKAELTTECTPVQTSNGTTYQKLIQYTQCTPSKESATPSSAPVPSSCLQEPTD